MFVADHGASFLPLYEPDVSSAHWQCNPVAVRSAYDSLSDWKWNPATVRSAYDSLKWVHLLKA